MKTKNFLKILFIFAVMFTIANIANAQIKYNSNGKLTIGNVTPYSFYQATIYGSAYFKDYSNHFFQIDITPAATRLASHYDQVVFYNTAAGKFNSIQVQSVYNYSDARAKTNIKALENGLDIIKQLRPVSYDFINGTTSRSGGDGKELGLLAQEVEEILPNIVFTDEEGKKLINYTALMPLMINAIKTLQQEVDQLKRNKK
ncbi:tail fiber domain-containing protein [Phocaeicola sp.]